MEHNTSEIDLLTVALPRECLAIVISYLGLLELANLYEASKFFATLLASSTDWKRSVVQFFTQRDLNNFPNYSRNINWRIMAKRVGRITEWRKSLRYEIRSGSPSDSTEQALIEKLPRVCQELHATLNLEKPRQLIALSNEHVVFMDSANDLSPLTLAHVYRIQQTGCVLVKSIRRCTAHYWHKDLNILVLLKQKGVVKLNMSDASQECTRVYVLPSLWRKGPHGSRSVVKPVINDVREVDINGELSLIATIQSGNVLAFVNLTSKLVLNVVRDSKRSHWLSGSKVAILVKSSLSVIDIAQKDKNKRVLVANIQHATPILDFVPNKTGEILLATYSKKALKIRICLWPLGALIDTGISFPAPVVPTLDLQLKENEQAVIINRQIYIKLSKRLE